MGEERAPGPLNPRPVRSGEEGPESPAPTMLDAGDRMAIFPNLFVSLSPDDRRRHEDTELTMPYA